MTASPGGGAAHPAVPGRAGPGAVARAAALATALFTAGLAGVAVSSARGVAALPSTALAQYVPQKNMGMLLQREALERRVVLPMYGSSELVTASAYRASEFFATAPTGFIVAPVGNRGTPLLLTAMQLAGAGDWLRGRKVAVDVSPDFFGGRDLARGYAANFSSLLAYALLLDRSLEPAWRRLAARLMLRHPGTLEGDRTLELLARTMSDEGPIARLTAAGVVPLAWTERWMLERQDELRTLHWLWAWRAPVPPPVPGAVDWHDVLADATRRARLETGDNPIGVVRRNWRRYERVYRRAAGSTDDARYLDALRASESWDELDIVLALLRAHGARPLLIALPYKGAYEDWRGVSSTARRAFYGRVRRVAAAAGVPCRVFEEHDGDREFLRDVTHPGPKGWAYIDATLDAFYHDSLR